MKKLLLFMLLLPAAAVAQNTRYDNVALGPKGPIANALVAFCTQPANTVSAPCTPLANLCSSLTDTTCTSPNPVVADALGNYFAYVQSGQVPFTVQIYGPKVAQPLVLVDQGVVIPGSVPLTLPNPANFPGPISSQSLTSTGPITSGPCTNIFNSPCPSAIQFNGPDAYCMAGTYDQWEDCVDPATGFSAMGFSPDGKHMYRGFLTDWNNAIPYSDGNVWGYNAVKGIPTVLPNLSISSQTGLINGSISSLLSCTDTSAVANTIICNPAVPLNSYTKALLVEVKVANTNTGATTINVSGLGAKNVTNGGPQAYSLVGGEMPINSSWLLSYDGTEFQLLDFPVVFCDQFNGTSADQLIQNAISASTASRAAIVDCRNLPPSPTPNFLSNPFKNLIGTGYTGNTQGVLLLPFTKMITQTPIVIPTGWEVYGGGPQFGSLNNGAYIQAGANFPAKYTTGTITTVSCQSASPPITCTITGSGTTWNNTANVVVGEDFTLCSTTGGNSGGGFCTTSATANPTAGLITSITDATHLVIEVPVSGGLPSLSGVNVNYVIQGAVIEMGDESASTVQPANFGVRIGGLKLDCNGISGCIPLANYSCQNLCGFIDSVYINPADSIGFDMEGFGGQNAAPQNAGPWFPLWIVCNAGKCGSGTIGANIRGFSSVPVLMDGWSIAVNSVSGATPLDVESPAKIQHGHFLVAGAANAVEFGSGFACPIICRQPGNIIAGGSLDDINISNGGTGAAVHVGSGNTNYSIHGLKANASGITNLLKDDTFGCTIPLGTTPGTSETSLESYMVGDTTATRVSTSSVPGCGGFNTSLIVHGVTNVQFINGDQTLTAPTSLTTILTFPLPTTAAATTYTYTCALQYQVSASSNVNFGVQGATTAPNKLSGYGTLYTTNTGTSVQGAIATPVSTTTATNIFAATAQATTATTFQVQFQGIFAAKAGGSTFNVMGSVSTGNLVIKDGSMCWLL